MSPPPDLDNNISPRYAERRSELESATKTAVTSAKEVGRVLALAGDLLRRMESLGDSSREVLAALEKVEAKAADAYVESIDAAAERTQLARAMDEAFEAMLEEGEERALYMQSAETALAARDALASVRAAMALARFDTTKLDGKVAQIDRDLSKRARTLIALNALRRREALALDPAERDAAWWYSSRSKCDFLASLYSPSENDRPDVTQKHNAAHLAICEDCQRDVEASSLAYTPDHVAASSLWRREHGQATAAELAFMDAHARDCKDCKRAIDVATVADE